MTAWGRGGKGRHWAPRERAVRMAGDYGRRAGVVMRLRGWLHREPQPDIAYHLARIAAGWGLDVLGRERLP